MKLFDLLEDSNIYYNGSDMVINNITTCTKNLKPNDIFICLKGEKADGHDFAEQALTQGAKLIVTQKDLGYKNKQIIVGNTRQTYASFCAKFFNKPSNKLKMIAITGTNGKTTTSSLIKQLLTNLMDKPIGLIGTIQNEIGNINFPAKYTTPDPYELNTILKKCLELGCEYVIIEASSHALDQSRLYGINFLIGVFTNLTHDHLDYHRTMDKYFKTKCKLFNNCKNAIINIDDEYGKKLFNLLNNKNEINIVSISCNELENADYIARNINYFTNKVKYSTQIKEQNISQDCVINMPGKHSVYNALTAFSVAASLGFSAKDIASSFKKCSGVCGRSEVIYNKGNLTIIRDYAHGPDGLKNILKTLKPFAKNRLVVLFGCAGRRDRLKRKEMANIVSMYSDLAVLTSDNPRDEDEWQILNDAKVGFEGSNAKYKIIADRLEAIKWVLTNKQNDDLILLAGKGHENYQVLDQHTIYFDEYEIVNDLLKAP